jgi:hypothetical protein
MSCQVSKCLAIIFYWQCEILDEWAISANIWAKNRSAPLEEQAEHMIKLSLGERIQPCMHTLLFWFRLIGSSLHKCLDNASKEQHGYFDWLSEFWLIEWVSECVKRDYAAYTGTGRGMYFLLLLAFCGGFLFCVALCLCPLWIHFLWSGRKLACTALHWLHCTLSTPTTRNMASGTRTQAKHMDGMHGWNGRAKQVLYSKSSSEFVSFQGTDLIMRLLLKCFTAKVWRCTQ